MVEKTLYPNSLISLVIHFMSPLFVKIVFETFANKIFKEVNIPEIRYFQNVCI